MRRIFRGVFIIWTVLRFGLDELVLSGFEKPWVRLLRRMVSVGRNLKAPRGERLRQALEALGPIFVKFGQVMSTRRDLLPPDIADELAHLQDRVPPFDSDVAIAIIEKAFGRPLANIFETFNLNRSPVRPSPRSTLRRFRAVGKSLSRCFVRTCSRPSKKTSP